MKFTVKFTYKGRNVEWVTESPILVEQDNIIDDVSALTIIAMTLGDLNIMSDQESLIQDITISHQGKIVYRQMGIEKKNTAISKSCFLRKHGMKCVRMLLGIISTYILWAKQFECCRLCSPFDYETAEAITDILYVIASGYVVSYVFYIMTVCVPYCKKRKIIRKHLAEEIRYLKDTFDEAFRGIGNGIWYESEDFREVFYNTYWKVQDGRAMNEATKQYMREHIDIFDNHLHQVLSNIEYLDSYEAEVLYNVLHSYSFAQIRCRFNKQEDIYDDKPNALRIIQGLQQAYKDISALYTSMGVVPNYLKKKK